jgi:hypothetical protein
MLEHTSMPRKQAPRAVSIIFFALEFKLNKYQRLVSEMEEKTKLC